MKRTLSLALLATLAAAPLTVTAEPPAPAAKPPAATAPPVTTLTAEDEKIEAAIAAAQKSVDQFVAVLQKPKPTQNTFSVKVELVEEGKDVAEEVWLAPVAFKNGTFEGTLNNQPVELKSFKLGQKITVPKADIIDWMFIDSGKLVGGYTMRVQRASMTTAERTAFDSSVPFKFE
jgi:uncharacterized protein YegJ (DUF2314 family)